MRKRSTGKCVSKGRSKSESCDLCARVPGITPDQVAGPAVCAPGGLEKAIGDGAALVEFRMDGCGACKLADEQIMPKIQATKVQVTIGGVPSCDKLADKHKVNATPTFIVFKQGKETWRSEGVTKPLKDLEEIRKQLGAS